MVLENTRIRTVNAKATGAQMISNCASISKIFVSFGIYSLVSKCSVLEILFFIIVAHHSLSVRIMTSQNSTQIAVPNKTYEEFCKASDDELKRHLFADHVLMYLLRLTLKQFK